MNRDTEKPSQAEGEDPDRPDQGRAEPTGRPSQAEGEDPDRPDRQTPRD
ncbi:hypothetical protein ACFC3F_14930 [Microbacterium sp. NPDC055910]